MAGNNRDSSFTKQKENKQFSNIKFTQNVKNKNYQHTIFISIDAKSIEFVKCDFSYCIFDECYFHQAKFVDCKFIGTKIRNSNFRNTTLIGCDFKYASFENSIIPISEMVNNLPDWANVRKDILSNLYINAKSTGNYSELNLIVKEEIKAEKEHWRNARKKPDYYYKKKYKGFKNRLNVYWKSLQLWISSIFWGHGEFPFRLFISSMVFLLIIGIIIMIYNWNSLSSLNMIDIFNLLFSSFHYSLNTFIDLPIISNLKSNDVINFIIILMRYVYFGLFINIIFRKFSRR